MSRRAVSFAAVVGLALLALVIPRIGGSRTLGTVLSRSLRGMDIDDELASLSIPLAKAALWPSHHAAQRAAFDSIFHDQPQPNDVLAFSTALRYAQELSPAESAALFAEELAALESATEDRLYLAVTLLPLSSSSGLCRGFEVGRDLPSTYIAARWPRKELTPQVAGDRRRAYDRIVKQCSG